VECAGALVESLLDSGYGAGVGGEKVDGGDAIVDGSEAVLETL